MVNAVKAISIISPLSPMYWLQAACNRMRERETTARVVQFWYSVNIITSGSSAVKIA